MSPPIAKHASTPSGHRRLNPGEPRSLSNDPQPLNSEPRPSGGGPTAARTIRIALLGCGTVGGRVAATLRDEHDRLLARTGLDLRLVRILVRKAGPRRSIFGGIVTERFEEILEQRPDVVIEALGGAEPAATFIERLLEAGVHVVSANKTAIAHHGPRLRAAATRGGVILAHEAAVASAIPVLAALRHLRGDEIQSVRGIVNGSTNFILDRMTEAGLSRDDALREARRRGLVEPDPSADVSGRDAAEKLCLLAHAAGFGEFTPVDVDRAGIEAITAEDVLAARRHGYAIKLVAEAVRTPHGVTLRVGPTLLPRDHRLARVRLEENGVEINALLGGEIFLQGAGAGPEPTTSALLGDVLRVLRAGSGPELTLTGHDPDAPPRSRDHASRDAGLSNDAKTSRDHEGAVSPSLASRSHVPPAIPRIHLVRLACDRRAITPARVLEPFREHGVGFREIDVTPRSAILLTHAVPVDRIERAVAAIERVTPTASLVVPEASSARRRPSSAGEAGAEIVASAGTASMAG